MTDIPPNPEEAFIKGLHQGIERLTGKFITVTTKHSERLPILPVLNALYRWSPSAQAKFIALLIRLIMHYADDPRTKVTQYNDSVYGACKAIRQFIINNSYIKKENTQ